MYIELNKYYKNRKGEVIKITENTTYRDYPFMSSGMETYTKDGRYLQCVTDSRDLIEEVIPTPAVRVLEVQTNTRDFVSAMEESKGKVYAKFDKIARGTKVGGVRLNIGDGPYPYSYFPDQVEEGIICPITGEFIAMKNETKVEEKQEVTKVEYGVVYIANVAGSWFNRGERIVLQEDDGTDCPWFDSEDGRVKRECYYIKDLGVYTPSPKPNLKLEVGKKYKTKDGRLVTVKREIAEENYKFIIDDNGIERWYTEDGFHHWERGESDLNIIEEVIEQKTKTKQETKEMKYYRGTKKQIFKVGDVVILHYDDGSSCPRYKNVNTGELSYCPTRDLEEINVKITTLVKGPASRMIKHLEDEGWRLTYDSCSREVVWSKEGEPYFRGDMLQYCGQPRPTKWSWNDEWLETKYEFESLVKPKPSLNHRQFLIDFMRKKQELSHPSYLYTGDVNEMKNDWSDEDCERVANDIINEDEWGFNASSCPFCVYNNNVDLEDKKCEECSYGNRHGICANTGSDYYDEVAPNKKDGFRGELKAFVTNYPGVGKK